MSPERQLVDVVAALRRNGTLIGALLVRELAHILDEGRISVIRVDPTSDNPRATVAVTFSNRQRAVVRIDTQHVTPVRGSR